MLTKGYRNLLSNCW